MHKIHRHLNRAQLEKLASAAPVDKGRFLVRIRSAGGLTAYVRPDGSTDNLRFHDRLHPQGLPGRSPSYANPLTTELWDADQDPQHFEELWQATADGPLWKEEL